MNRCYGFLLAGACAGLLALATPAAAGGGEDLPPADRCGTGPFSGAYIGASVGYANARTEAKSLTTGVSLDDRDSGWAIGGHVGYNRQCGRMLFGVETDISWLNVDPSSTISGYVDGVGPFRQTVKADYDYFGTVRGRVGVVRDNLLFYATGGLAYASRDHKISGFIGDTDFSESDSDVSWGWTIGGGVEFLRDDRWLVRAEVLYVDLQDETHDYTTRCPDCGGRVRWDDDFVVARLGVSLKLHRDEPVHEPLK